MAVGTSTRRFAVGLDEDMVALTVGLKSSYSTYYLSSEEARELAEFLTKAANAADERTDNS